MIRWKEWTCGSAASSKWMIVVGISILLNFRVVNSVGSWALWNDLLPIHLGNLWTYGLDWTDLFFGASWLIRGELHELFGIEDKCLKLLKRDFLKDDEKIITHTSQPQLHIPTTDWAKFPPWEMPPLRCRARAPWPIRSPHILADLPNTGQTIKPPKKRGYIVGF